MNYILSFWKRAPWWVWWLAIYGSASLLAHGLVWSALIHLIVSAITPPLFIYLLERKK